MLLFRSLTYRTNNAATPTLVGSLKGYYYTTIVNKIDLLY